MAVFKAGEIESVPGSQEITTSGRPTPAVTGWTEVVRMDGSRLKANATYGFVYVCNIGSFRNFRPEEGAIHCELTVQRGSGTFASPLHSVDPHYAPWQEQYDIVRRKVLDGRRGGSFMHIEWFNVGAVPVDYSLVARIAKVNDGSSPGAQFLVNNASILAFDLDTLDAESDLAHAKGSSIVKTNIADSTQVADLRIALTLPSSGDWFIFHMAAVEGANAISPTRFWVQDDSGSLANLEFFQGVGHTAYGEVNPARSRQCTGQVTFARGVTNLNLEQRSGSAYGPNPPQSVYHFGKILAVKPGLQMFPFGITTEPAPDFWAPKYQGTPVSGLFTVTLPRETVLIATADCDHSVNYASHHPRVEINGGVALDPEFFLQGGIGGLSNMPVNTIIPVADDPGIDKLGRVYGERNFFDLLNRGGEKNRGHNVRLIGFTLRPGIIGLGPGQIAGPPTPIIPARETPFAVSAIPVLPIEPSYVLPVQEESVIRELRIPRGDVIVHPKFVKGRRVFRLSWDNLSKSQGETLFDFFGAALTNFGGTFTWKAPGDAAVVPYTIQEAREYRGDQQPEGHYRAFAVTVVELVFVVP